MIKISATYCNLPVMDTLPAIALATAGSTINAECVKNVMVIQTPSLQCESNDDVRNFFLDSKVKQGMTQNVQARFIPKIDFKIHRRT